MSPIHRLRHLVVFFLLLTTVSRPAFSAGPSEPIPLWPGTPPGEDAPIGEEKDTSGENGRLVAGKHVIRLGNVSQPTITVYTPSEKNSGIGVVVCPGGGYSILALDLEGTEVCEWLNSLGVTAVLLKYRVPTRKGDERHLLPLQDAQRALGLVRFRAQEWQIDPRRIGILGFSAGGHLSAHLSTNFRTRSYPAVDNADQESCRPDFAVIIYPGYLVTKEDRAKVSPGLDVTSETPPTFLAQTEDDPVGVESSLGYYTALRAAKVPGALHLYSIGGHGYGLRPSEHSISHWPDRVAEWMHDRGLFADPASRSSK